MQVLHFRFSFEPRFSEVDKSLFLAPPLLATSCNVHYSGSILYDNERETWSKSIGGGGGGGDKMKLGKFQSKKFVRK